MKSKRLKFPNNLALVSWIKLYLYEEYPDIEVPQFIIEAILLGFIDYIKAGLTAGQILTITSLGKFFTRKKENKYGNEQYYIKFRPSKHLVMGLREAKGTLTDYEKRAIREKEVFVQHAWNSKQQYLEKRAKQRQVRIDICKDKTEKRHAKERASEE